MRKDKLPKEVFFSAFDFGLTGEELEELYKSGELEEIIAKTCGIRGVLPSFTMT